MIRIVAIDDESAALHALRSLVESYPSELKWIKGFTNSQEAQEYLNKTSDVDALFLDVNLFKIDGFSFYNQLKVKLPLVFCTAHDSYALKAFEVNALDYLTKPVSRARFQSTLNKLKQLVAKNKSQSEILIKSDQQWLKINTNSILFIKAMDDYVKMYLKDSKPLILNSSLKDVFNMLPSEQFVKCHRSYAISLNHTTKLNASEVWILNHKIPVSRANKQKVLRHFKKAASN